MHRLFSIGLVLLVAACGETAAPFDLPDASVDAGLLTDAGFSRDAGQPPDAGPALPTGVTRIGPIDTVGGREVPGLDAIVQDAPIVAVGETIHFSLGYARARAQIIRHLVERSGFRAIAFEGSWTLAFGAQRFVDGEGTPDDLHRSLTFSAWMNVPTTHLFLWLRDYNATHPEDPVAIFGIDVQDPTGDGLMIREVVAGLETNGTLTSSQAAGWIDDLDACVAASARSRREAYTTHVDAPFMNFEQIWPQDRRDACAAMVRRRHDTLDTLEASLDRRDHNLLRAALVALAAFNDELFEYRRNARASYEARDRGMADVFELMREVVGTDRRIVNFAHNAHNRRNADGLESDFTFVSYGSHLADRLGDDYLPIGFFAATVAWNWPNQVGRGSWTTTSSDAVETILLDVTADNILVDLRTTELFEPGRTYEHGHANQVRSAPRDNYDAILFMRSSEAWDGQRGP